MILNTGQDTGMNVYVYIYIYIKDQTRPQSMCMYMEANGTCAALQADGLLLWKRDQAKSLIFEGDGGGYDDHDDDDGDDDDSTMSMTWRTMKRLCKVCHAG